MGNSPANFVKFEDPQVGVNSNNWESRIEALATEHKGKWAKYGPYSSNKTASTAKIRVEDCFYEFQKMHSNSIYYLRTSVSVEQEKCYLYIRVS